MSEPSADEPSADGPSADEPSDAAGAPIDAAEFFRVELRVATVRSAARHPTARKPAYVLELDFGPLGRRTSSAQLVDGYAPEALVGRQVVCAFNLTPRRVAGVVSEVLVLAAIDADGAVVLLRPDRAVADGARVH